MELTIAKTKKKLDLADEIFSKPFNESIIHQVVTAYMAAGRAGTKAQKTRAEVSGGGAKPWRQKGTGRARAGTIRSPIWRTGGVTFAAKPRSYEQKVNKKMYRVAICSILSELIRQNRLILVESLILEERKTKLLIGKLKEINVEGKILIICDKFDENLYFASRNIPNLEVAIAIDPISLVKADKVLITVNAIKNIEELLK